LPGVRVQPLRLTSPGEKSDLPTKKKGGPNRRPALPLMPKKKDYAFFVAGGLVANVSTAATSRRTPATRYAWSNRWVAS
jgi:hypothetical protein